MRSCSWITGEAAHPYRNPLQSLCHQSEDRPSHQYVLVAHFLRTLLESQSDRLGKCDLANAEQRAAQPDAGADMDVDRVGKPFAGHAPG